MTKPTQAEPSPEQAAQALLACIHEMARFTPHLTPLLSGRDPGEGGVEQLHELAETMAKMTELVGYLPDARAAGGTPASASDVGARCAELLMQNIDAATRLPDDIPDSCVLRGVSPAFPSWALLEFLSTHRANGTLRIVTAEETFTLEVADGYIAHAVSDNTPTYARLGDILLRRGAIDLRQLNDFFERYSSSSELMGAALEREELVDKHELQAALEQQVQSLFNRLFAQQEGTFSFYEGNPNHPEIHLRMNVILLLLESARMIDEQNRPDQD